MGSIKEKIEALSKVNLEDFDIDILEVMRSEIQDKQNDLNRKIDEINNSIKGANVYKEFYGKTKLLPDKFSTPLRRIISKQREIKEIEKYNHRYEEELRRLKNIISRKKLNDIQNKKTRIPNFSLIKDKIIAILITLVLGLLVFEFSNPNLTHDILWNIFIIDSLCCLVFQINFFSELFMASSKRWYIKNHWIDFITSIPIPSYEIMRSGRAIRLFRLLRILRVLRVIKLIKLVSFFWKGMDSLSEILDVKLMKRTIIYSIGLLILGAFVINHIEFSNGANKVGNYKESLWWSFNAIVTGGFADIYNPTTSGGMVLTTLLVFVGMVLISVFTATLTSMMVGDDSNKTSDNIKLYVENRLKDIEKKIDRINKEVSKP